LEQLSCPLLAIAGDPGRLPLDALREAKPTAAVQKIHHTGHFLHVFAAQQVQDALQDWLIRWL
jgi:pimeloyl-ACP methyl ester carboxylesterase